MSSLSFLILRILLLLLAGGVPFAPYAANVSPTICYFLSAVFGLIYVVVGIVEIKKHSVPAGEVRARFGYLPFMVISKRILRTAFFVAISLVILLPGTRILKLEPMVTSIWIGEVAFFFASWFFKGFSIILYPETIFIKQEKETRIFPEEIKHIEFRYDIIYLVLRNRGTIKINPEFAPEKERAELMRSLVRWLEDHRVLFTEEAREQLFAKDLL